MLRSISPSLIHRWFLRIYFVAACKQIGSHVVGMVHYPVRIKSAEVVLQVRQEQRVHPECIDQHVVGTLNREETDVYGIADEPVRTFYLIAADFLRLEQFPLPLKKNARRTGTVRRALQGSPFPDWHVPEKTGRGQGSP